MSRVNKYGRKRKKWKRIIGLVVAVAAVYLGGMAYFNTHYFPKTTVGNIGIGMKSKKGAKAYLKDELEGYTLTIIEKDGEEAITANEAGMTFSDLNKVDKILDNQPAKQWFYKIFEDYDYDELNVQVNRETLSKHVDTLKCMNPPIPQGPVNASISYNTEEKKFEIVPETIGNTVDKEHFLDGLTDSMVHHDKTISLVDDTYYVQPKYYSYSKEVQDAEVKMNKYLDGIVTYKDGGMKTKTYRKDIASMLTYTDNFQVKFDNEKVKNFVRKNVSKEFNSLKGKIPRGITAWKVGVEKESKKLIKNIKTGKRTTRKPEYTQEGFDREGYTIGKTYIDISLTEQKMWYVKDGEIALSSDVVTGNESTGHGSSTGFYRIAYKQRDHLMVKYNSFVHYWMPYNTTIGVGLHDASWRSDFGGKIYRTNGSHGCINMPPSKAAELYGMVSAGTAVYVHW